MTNERLSAICEIVSFFLVTTDLYGSDLMDDIIGLMDRLGRALRLGMKENFVWTIFFQIILYAFVYVEPRQHSSAGNEIRWKLLSSSVARHRHA
jgi:hypothetical protein